jgi:hypothetical protein
MFKKRALLIFLLIFFSFVYLRYAYSKEFIINGPLIARPQNPVYLMSLGQEPTRAVVNPKGRYSLWLNMNYTNLYTVGASGNNQVFLDMEIARVAFNIKYGIGRDMEVGLELPFLHFNGGYFDAFIQDYHHAFGFPNGGRQYSPNGAFVYRITQNGRVLYNRTPRDFGISDIIFNFKYNFLPEGRRLPAMAWRFRYKFPTGPANSGLGGGNIDYSLGLALEKNLKRWHFYMNLDYLIVSGNRNFDALYNNQVFAWLTAVEFNISTPISIVAQLMGSTPLLSGLGTPKWDSYPLDLVIGIKGTHKNLFWKNDFFWQWGFTEDLNSTGPSPDITTMLVVGVRFGSNPSP